MEGAQFALAGGIGRGGGVGEVQAAEADHEVMLIGEAGGIEAAGGGALDKAGELDMCGQVDLAGARERIGFAAMSRVGAERAGGAIGAIVFLSGEAVVDRQDIAADQSIDERVDPIGGEMISCCSPAAPAA